MYCQDQFYTNKTKHFCILQWTARCAGASSLNMAAKVCFEEVLLSAMDFVEEEDTFYYDCECGDRFLIGLDELLDGEDIADCPSCSLLLRVTDVDVRAVVPAAILPALRPSSPPASAATHTRTLRSRADHTPGKVPVPARVRKRVPEQPRREYSAFAPDDGSGVFLTPVP